MLVGELVHAPCTRQSKCYTILSENLVWTLSKEQPVNSLVWIFGWTFVIEFIGDVKLPWIHFYLLDSLVEMPRNSIFRIGKEMFATGGGSPGKTVCVVWDFDSFLWSASLKTLYLEFQETVFFTYKMLSILSMTASINCTLERYARYVVQRRERLNQTANGSISFQDWLHYSSNSIFFFCQWIPKGWLHFANWFVEVRVKIILIGVTMDTILFMRRLSKVLPRIINILTKTRSWMNKAIDIL